MGLAQRNDYEYDRVENLRRNFERADQRFRSYKLIKNQDRIETVFERLRQERLQALTLYKEAMAEVKVEKVNSFMSQRHISLGRRLRFTIQENGIKAFFLWLWWKI